MRVVPRTVNGKINFYNSHVSKWASDPAKIGSTPEEIADLQDKLDAAKAARLSQRQAMDAARSATLGLKLALKALANAGGCAISRARIKAQMDGSNTAYFAAQIRVPKKPAPIKPPGEAYKFTFILTQVGELILKWKCDNPRGSQGTVYQVSRQLNSTGPYQPLGISGQKKFIDESLPAGATSVTYKVIALRGKTRGEEATYSITLGQAEPVAKIAMPRAA